MVFRAEQGRGGKTEEESLTGFVTEAGRNGGQPSRFFMGWRVDEDDSHIGVHGAGAVADGTLIGVVGPASSPDASLRGLRAVHIPAPLEDISAHVVDAELVCQFGAGGFGAFTDKTAEIPGDLVHFIASAIEEILT